MEEEAISRRMMPQNIEAEQSVVGSMLLDAEAVAIACDALTAEDFYDRRCRLIFSALADMYRDGKDNDLITLSEKLKEDGAPEEIRGIESLKSILSVVPTSANIKQYVRIVRDKSFARKVIRTSEEVVNRGYTDTGEASSLIESAESEIFRLSQLYNSEKAEQNDIKKIMIDTVKSIESAAAAGGSVTGIPTGFYDLDYRIAGLQPSDLILIAARPSMGKTAFALNIAEYAALKKNIPTAIFSLEMSAELLAKRLLSMNSHVDSQKIRTGQLSIDEWGKLAESASLFANSKLYIDDTGGINLTQFRTKCRKLKAQFGVQLIFIDYLQLMSGDDGGARINSRQEEISRISRGLKSIAREINCPIVALSQLSRAVESRTDKRPMLSDLRESGAIEQDADVVMFLYRDDYYKEDSDDKGITEIIIGKQRNGPTCTVKLRWLSNLTKFANLEHRKD
ncbi:MAG: replicative DNA helicase [Eubacterium sp.]|nr:replicative DNA helicase [Eubacterium sp.]